MTAPKTSGPLDAALTAQDARAARQLIDGVDDRAQRGEAVEVLARHGAAGSEVATQLLVVAVDRWGLARAAVKQVLVDEPSVEEVAQDTLVVVATSLGSFRGDAKFLTWLHTVAKRRAIDHLRRQRQASEPPPGPAARMSSLIASRDAVDQLLARLPANYREAVVLRDVHQLPYAEVAEQLGCAQSTARTRVARARAIAASMLEDTEGLMP